LKTAAARQKKNYQEKCREASFKNGDWVWKVDSALKPGKLRQKNLGPYLIINQTGPVTYTIQQQEGARESTLHVDKLYPYTPMVGEELVSWIPLLPIKVDTACQSHETATTSVASQTIEPEQQPPDGPNLDQDTTIVDPSQMATPDIATPAATGALPRDSTAVGCDTRPEPLACGPPRRSKREKKLPLRYRAVSNSAQITNCLAKAVLKLVEIKTPSV